MFMDERMDSLDEIRGLAPDVASMMGDMLRSPKVPPIVKVRIMEMILERTYGKPEASVRLTSAQQNVEAAQARIAAIVSAIRIADDCDGSGVDCRMGRWGQGNPAHPVGGPDSPVPAGPLSPPAHFGGENHDLFYLAADGGSLAGVHAGSDDRR